MIIYTTLKFLKISKKLNQGDSMNKTMALIAGTILIVAGIFYFINSEKENKVFQKEKQETSTQKKVKNIQQKEQVKTKKQEKLVQKKKEENNPRGLIIYKNDETNKGYNMELKVPAKWAHLDYSRLGQPKEVALNPDEVEKNKKILCKSEECTNVFYLDAAAEKKLLELYQDKEIRDIFFKFYDDEFGRRRFERENRYSEELDLNGQPGLYGEYVTLEEYYSDINNLITINEKTGLKEESPYGESTLGLVFDYFCGGGAWQTGCNTYEEALKKQNPVVELITKEEFDKVFDFIHDRYNYEYVHNELHYPKKRKWYEIFKIF